MAKFLAECNFCVCSSVIIITLIYIKPKLKITIPVSVNTARHAKMSHVIKHVSLKIYRLTYVGSIHMYGRYITKYRI